MSSFTCFGLIFLKVVIQNSVFPCDCARVCDLKDIPSYKLEVYENNYSNFVQKPFQSSRHMVNDTDIANRFLAFQCGRMEVHLPPPPIIVSIILAPAKSFPWHVVLNFHSSSLCGGALILNRWVLTVASCLMMGVKSVSYWGKKEGEVHIVSRLIHEDYNDVTGDNNIALLKVSPLPYYDELARPACFPIFINLTTSSTCYMSGFAPGTQETLRYSPIHFMPQEICSYAWKTRRGIHVDRRSICGDFGTSDVCYDDLGNPLTCLVNGRYYIIGVVDRYDGHCQNSDFPMTFIRVFEYADWIYNTVQKHSKYDV